MRKLILFLALAMGGCAPKEDGAVTVLDHDYTVELAGTQAAGFTSPDGLLWDNGSILMADEAGIAIRRWQAGKQVVTLADKSAGFSSPEDLVRDDAGNIWFSDDNIGGLRRLDKDGHVTLVASAKQGLISTEGIAVAQDGDILIGDGERHRVFKVTPQGQVSDFIRPEEGLTKPESMTFDEAGNLYIADNEDDVLYLRSPDGHLQPLVKGRSDFSPESLTWADHGLFITDSKHGNLWRYTQHDGLKCLAAFVGEFSNVQGVTTTPSGDIYLSIRAGPGAKRGYVLRMVRRHN